jgi:predicted RNA-binding Zn-ribbon protein involved in translation (DUF1610 family)
MKRRSKGNGDLFVEESGQLRLVDKSAEQQAMEKGKVECLGMTFDSEDARRAYFTDRLREKLADPEFRKTPGFPNGTDEDIIRMSDPPWYTACPNPFLDDFLRQYASVDDKHASYATESYAGDVSVGKGDPIYTAHSYHTKVPPAAILRYILHYTKPGDIILDGFCGTGMTGAACGLAEHPTAILRAELSTETKKLNWGKRHAVLCDLSPLATFIAYNVNTGVNKAQVSDLFGDILGRAEQQFGYLYETKDVDGRAARLHYAVWSEMFICSECTSEFSFWDAAIDLKSGEQKEIFPCPNCGANLKKRTSERSFRTAIDPLTRSPARTAKREVVYLSFENEEGRGFKSPDSKDIKLAHELDTTPPAEWVPLREIPKGDRYYKDGLHLVGLDYFHRFYFPRTLHVLAFIWNEIDSLEIAAPIKNRLRFIVTSMLDRNLTIRNRFVVNRHNPRGRINGPLANTLYVPGLSVEQNPFEALSYKKDDIGKAAKRRSTSHIITVQDSASISKLENVVDYIFVDPPFGHNIMYSELNGVSESWLGITTDSADEAIISEPLGKDHKVYLELMSSCFRRFYKLLKPGRWMTVEFHNSQNSVWNIIQESINKAGFVISDVRTLDKQKGTINQEYYQSGAVKTDLVISAYKPSTVLNELVSLKPGSSEGMWRFVEDHLRRLPVFQSLGKTSAVIPDRQPHLLYDRMVAFHVQRGITIPVSAADFYVLLSQRIPIRDGMFFLPEQVTEYDRRRATAGEPIQQELFIVDEASAVEWLRRALKLKPQTFQEMQPQFMQEIKSWSKHESTIELRQLLEQNFLVFQGEGPVPGQIHGYLSSNYRDLRGLEKTDPILISRAVGRWFVPDVAKQADLEKVRDKALLREFSQYLESKQRKLEVFRTEAVRAGFKAAYEGQDYKTIVNVASKLPENVLQEDEKLLMYFDVASMRLGDE